MRVDNVIFDKIYLNEFEKKFQKQEIGIYKIGKEKGIQLTIQIITFSEGDAEFKKGKINKKYKRKSITGKSKKEIYQKAIEYINNQIERQKYTYINSASASFYDIFKNFMEQEKKKNLRDTSIRRTLITYEKNIEPFIDKSIIINDVTYENINYILSKNIEQGYSQSTMKKIFNLLNRFCKYAVNNDFITKNPCDNDEILPINTSAIENAQESTKNERTKLWLYAFNNGSFSKEEFNLLEEKLQFNITESELETSLSSNSKTNKSFKIDKKYITNVQQKIKNRENLHDDFIKFCSKFKNSIEETLKLNNFVLMFSPLRMKDKKEQRVLSAEEIKRMRNIIYNGYKATQNNHKKEYMVEGFIAQAEIFDFLLYTALRAGEVCGLKYSDVDFKNHQINICRAIKQSFNNDNENLMSKSQKQIGKPKTKNSECKITVPDKAIEILSSMKAKEPENYNGYILHKKNDFSVKNFISPNAIAKRFTNLMKYADIENASIHCLRHTSLTNVYKQTKDIDITQKLARHSLPSTTQNIYVHESEDDYKKAIKKIHI